MWQASHAAPHGQLLNRLGSLTPPTTTTHTHSRHTPWRGKTASTKLHTPTAPHQRRPHLLAHAHPPFPRPTATWGEAFNPGKGLPVHNTPKNKSAQDMACTCALEKGWTPQDAQSHTRSTGNTQHNHATHTQGPPTISKRCCCDLGRVPEMGMVGRFAASRKCLL
jgi:hypothetical protein